MNRIQFGEGGCEKTRKYLDSYISNELMVETNHEVLRHIEGCRACAAEVEARTRLRSRLKAAVNAQTLPPELQVRVREKIRTSQAGVRFSWMHAGWPRWAAVGMMAAALVMGVEFWVNHSDQLPALADRPGQNAYIQRVSANLAAVLKIGLGDHIHCSVFRTYPKNPPPLEKMEANLGPEYQGLVPVLRTAVPEGYRLVLAHRCGYAGRKFIHLTAEKDGELISLVVARKQPGESLSGLSPASRQSGIPIYHSAATRYQVAGFEAGDFLAYVVSDLRKSTNLQIASNLAAGVRDVLLKVPA
jgi:Putative zinc-finger